MKILLHLLVLSSLSSVIFGLAINQGQINVVQYQELAIINDSAPKAARLIDWTSSTNSPLKRGDTIVLTLNGISNTDEVLYIWVIFVLRTDKHVPIKDAQTELKYPPRKNVTVTWSIPPEWYLSKLGFNDKLDLFAYIQIYGKNETWDYNEVLELN